MSKSANSSESGKSANTGTSASPPIQPNQESVPDNIPNHNPQPSSAPQQGTRAGSSLPNIHFDFFGMNIASQRDCDTVNPATPATATSTNTTNPNIQIQPNQAFTQDFGPFSAPSDSMQFTWSMPLFADPNNMALSMEQFHPDFAHLFTTTSFQQPVIPANAYYPTDQQQQQQQQQPQPLQHAVNTQPQSQQQVGSAPHHLITSVPSQTSIGMPQTQQTIPSTTTPIPTPTSAITNENARPVSKNNTVTAASKNRSPVHVNGEKSSQFPHQLYSILCQNSNTSLYGWNDAGDQIYIIEVEHLLTELRARGMKAEREDSLHKNLNDYGFVRITDRRKSRHQQSGGPRERSEFKHPCFIRGQPDLLNQVIRKSGPKKAQRRREKRRRKQEQERLAQMTSAAMVMNPNNNNIMVASSAASIATNSSGGYRSHKRIKSEEDFNEPYLTPPMVHHTGTFPQASSTTIATVAAAGNTPIVRTGRSNIAPATAVTSATMIRNNNQSSNLCSVSSPIWPNSPGYIGNNPVEFPDHPASPSDNSTNGSSISMTTTATTTGNNSRRNSTKNNQPSNFQAGI